MYYVRFILLGNNNASIDLSNQGITDKEAKLIAEELETNNKLKELDLSYNIISNEGTEWIALAL